MRGILKETEPLEPRLSAPQHLFITYQIKVRIWTGWIFLSFLILHLLNHCLGLIGLEAASFGLTVMTFVLRGPWTSWILPTVGTLHVLCSLLALTRRRFIKSLTWYQKWQYGTGFALPLLSVAHVAHTRALWTTEGINHNYITYLQELWRPNYGWLLMLGLIIMSLGHGGLGFWFYLRSKNQQWANLWGRALMVLGITGFFGAHYLSGEVWLRSQLEPGWYDHAKQLQGPVGLDWRAEGIELYYNLLLGYLALFTVALVWRVLRQRTAAGITIEYAGGRKIKVPAGTSILEASNLAGIPHAQLCQGQGRCSTCRVFLSIGYAELPLALPDEEEVLQSLNVHAGTRLACQCRPTSDLKVDLLIPATVQFVEGAKRRQRFIGEEKDLVILFADIRGFTHFSEKMLPYDLVSVLNRYFSAVGASIEANHGYLDKFIGDGTLAVFGIDGDLPKAARGAIRAAQDLINRLDKLNQEITNDIAEPLRIGVGLHAGKTIIGEMGYKTSLSLTVIGDTVNTASRLESMTKTHKCMLIMSDQVAGEAGVELDTLIKKEVEIRGRDQHLNIWLSDDPRTIKIPSED